VVWLVVVVALGAVSTALLLVLVVALVRHIKVLAKALQAFQEQVRPALDEVARGSTQAQDRLNRISDRGLRDELKQGSGRQAGLP
jgi:F0F1-type ATP synthase membrane subunit b/b'